MIRHLPTYVISGEIDRNRYRELCAFCRQYPVWKVEASALLSSGGSGMDAMPHGSDPGDPTARAAERREKVMAKIDLVEQCAMAVDSGRWFSALILHLCNGKSYEVIRDIYSVLPTNNRTAFFSARKRFLLLLDQLKE